MSKRSSSSAPTSTPETKVTGKNGAIYLNSLMGKGEKVAVKTDWSLNLSKDYIDATTFGDTNSTYLVTNKTNIPSFTVYDEDPPPFDYGEARKLYEDDPVALAIIDRMATME